MPAAEQSPNAAMVNLEEWKWLRIYSINIQRNGIGMERLSRSERINHQAHGLFARSPTSCLSCCVWRQCLPDKDPMSDPPGYPHQMPSCLQMWLLPCSAYQTIQVCPMFPFFPTKWIIVPRVEALDCVTGAREASNLLCLLSSLGPGQRFVLFIQIPDT